MKPWERLLRILIPGIHLSRPGRRHHHSLVVRQDHGDHAADYGPHSYESLLTLKGGDGEVLARQHHANCARYIPPAVRRAVTWLYALTSWAEP